MSFILSLKISVERQYEKAPLVLSNSLISLVFIFNSQRELKIEKDENSHVESTSISLSFLLGSLLIFY